MPAKKSPWFNARTEPPVNGKDDALYEHRCVVTFGRGSPTKVPKSWLTNGVVCVCCQWRGLLRESDDA
jgi:hypothetical protein